MHFRFYLPLAILWVTHHGASSGATDHSAVVHFDMAPTATASVGESEGGRVMLSVDLELSSMIDIPEVPRIDQWLVRCQPRGHVASIADYSPRTETDSDLASTIQVKQSEEKNNSLGIGVNGNYTHQLRANAGLDHATKNTNSLQFDRVAPLHAVTASGTINRGRGVYFKLRWTAKQILEGQKTFQLVLEVPNSWRAGLIDVSVLAQSEQKSFAGWDRDSKTLGSANFVVAVYREEDKQAAAQARKMANAEYDLRNLMIEQPPSKPVVSLPTILQHVAIKLELEPGPSNQRWLERLMLDEIDPCMDKEIRKLPMPFRLAVLNYAEAREDFAKLNLRPPVELAVTQSD